MSTLDSKRSNLAFMTRCVLAAGYFKQVEASNYILSFDNRKSVTKSATSEEQAQELSKIFKHLNKY